MRLLHAIRQMRSAAELKSRHEIEVHKHMKEKALKFAAPALMLAAIISFTACKSNEGKGSTEVSRSQGRTGGMSTHKVTATVTGIDAANRMVTLKWPDGTQRTYTAGPEVRNFDQIRMGDRVTMKVTDEVALWLSRGEAPSSTSGSVITRAPEGSQPGAVMANTTQITGKIVSIHGRDVTLRFADGSTRTIKVGEDVNLAGLAPGDTVNGRVTRATAISVERP